MTKGQILKIVKEAFEYHVRSQAFETILGLESQIDGKEDFLKEVSDKLDTEELDEADESSDEVTRLINIIRINACVKRKGRGIKLSDYNLEMEIKSRQISVVQKNYVFIEDSISDTDIDFDNMDDDEIAELADIIEQVNIIDDKAIKIKNT